MGRNHLNKKDLFDFNGQPLNYETFLREKTFPFMFEEYNLVFKSILNGMLELRTIKYNMRFLDPHALM